MTMTLYTIPAIYLPGERYIVPAYLSHRFSAPVVGLEGVAWTWETYKLERMGIVVADVTPAQDTLLTAQANVIKIPALDNTIPSVAVRNQVQTVLETFDIPAQWVVVGMSYRTILRIVLGIFRFHGRLIVLLQRRFWNGTISLDTTVSQLSTNVVTYLQEAANHFGIDYSFVTGTTTIRELFRLMGEHWANTPFSIRGVDI
jgi:hypothetical protein